MEKTFRKDCILGYENKYDFDIRSGIGHFRQGEEHRDTNTKGKIQSIYVKLEARCTTIMPEA